ncbi:unnamed protein product [Alopecurus aequalis]
MKPSDLSLLFLEKITNGFSEDRILGSGGFGKVYKGVDKNGKEIAVKMLDSLSGFDDKHFTNELNSLMKVRHQNIVRLVGYCYEKRPQVHEVDGVPTLCTVIDRALCLEYLHGGSLDKHLKEEFSGLDWPTRLKIIKGICEGLNYLHRNSSREPIFHLDLKPENILLDNNMTPKIADFGLSRLFSANHTLITKVAIGTEAYIPPEFLQKRQISDKSDIFSLGVLIIDIMTRKGGYEEHGDMTSQSFVEHVYKNWRKRIESTQSNASQENDCHQVKRCIELALRCVEIDRHKRPSISDIIRELKQIDTSGSTPQWDQVVKIGQWGGVGGTLFDIKEAPRRLRSLIIGADEVIHSLEFTYDGHDGNAHRGGPWGSWGPTGHGNSRHSINLGLSEVIIEVRGTTDRVSFAQCVVTSLTIITNSGNYGPFGEVEGTPFQIPVGSNASIVGFFARVGWSIDALGVYVKPKQETEVSGHAKIGPWGGTIGQVHDIEVAPKRLESVTISSGDVIDSLSFSYYDHDRKHRTAGPWGGVGGSTHSETIQFGPLEFVTGLHGTIGTFAHVASADNIVTSLTLVTNIRTYGPFGEGGGIPFQSPMWGKGCIVGFFGHAESYVNAIGVYAHPNQEAMKEKPGLSKVGPWGRGGDRGSARDINIDTASPHCLEKITISYGAAINSLSFSYTDFNWVKHDVGPWGIPSGQSYEIVFRPREILVGVYGTISSPNSASQNAITSLTFVTSRRTYGPIGAGGGTQFIVGREMEECIVGFFGRADTCLDAIGVYIHRY